MKFTTAPRFGRAHYGAPTLTPRTRFGGVDLFLNQELQIWLKPHSICIDVTLSITVKRQNVQMTKKDYYYNINLYLILCAFLPKL